MSGGSRGGGLNVGAGGGHSPIVVSVSIFILYSFTPVALA